MIVVSLLKMYKGTSSHKMLIATPELDAAMSAVPQEYSVKLIAWTTHFFKSPAHLQPPLIFQTVSDN